VKVLIFDFDGTIADSFEVVLNITNQLASEFGYAAAQPEDIPHLKNLSSREIIKQSKVAPFKIPFLVRRLRGELNHQIHHLQPIAGIKPALFALQHQGYKLGIVTSNSTENVVAFLKMQGLEAVFSFIGSGLALFGKGRIIQRLLKHHHLNPADVLYVGDETRDIEAAHKIGIKVIAVSWGYNSSPVLAAEQPDFLIHHPEELLQVVQNLPS
jgi:phosphoglycolate phosphatase